MPFIVPSLATLIARAEEDLAARLGVEVPQIRRTNAAVFARVSANGGFTLAEYQRWISEQIMYDVAEAEILARWADIWGIDRVAAAAAAGNVTFTGTNGTAIPEGTVLVGDDGLEYATAAAGEIAAGEAVVAVAATAPGADGNRDAGDLLSLVSPIAGLSSAATVAAGGLAGGADAESDDSLRARFLGRIRQPPHGGAAFDYIAWTVETPGVTVARRGPNAGDERVWVSALENGPGTIVVRFMADHGAGGMAIPDAGDVAAVQAHIDTVRPVTAVVTAVAPTAAPIDFEIALTPDTAAVRAAVQAELADLLLREASPGGTILISHIREAVSIAAGESDHVLTAPAANVENGAGEIATVGDFTWS